MLHCPMCGMTWKGEAPQAADLAACWPSWPAPATAPRMYFHTHLTCLNLTQLAWSNHLGLMNGLSVCAICIDPVSYRLGLEASAYW
jgi:hypothetical protein